MHSASATIIVLGDPNAYQQAGNIYEGLKMLGILNKQQYEEMVRETMSFYEKRGADFQKEEAICNAIYACRQKQGLGYVPNDRF